MNRINQHNCFPSLQGNKLDESSGDYVCADDEAVVVGSKPITDQIFSMNQLKASLPQGGHHVGRPVSDSLFARRFLKI